MNRDTSNVDRRRTSRRAANDRRNGVDRRLNDRRHTNDRLDVSRVEHDELRERVTFLTRRVTRLEAEYQIQFTRIAQLQAELDTLSRKARAS